MEALRRHRIRPAQLPSDKLADRNYGIAGGQPGGPSANFLQTADGVERPLPTMPMNTQKLRRGDTFRHLSAGGGGYGDPLDRDPVAVLEDVLEEKVSVAAAARDYGVVIDAARRRRRSDPVAGPSTRSRAVSITTP